MTPEEIKYYRTKAVALIGHRYEDFAWSSLTEFIGQDETVDANVRKLNNMKEGRLYGFIKPYVAPLPVADSGAFTEQVEEARGLLSQPNAYTCQSTCIAMATGRTDVMAIRAELEAIGEPGDPGVMGVLLKKEFGDRYIFDDNACLSEIRDWLRAGEFLVSHGWWSASGHVICLDGVTIDAKTLGYKISVRDPWSEFNASTWSYDNPSVSSFDGDYSSHAIYASIVAGQSVYDAAAVYAKRELDSMRKGAWIHRILPAKKAQAPDAVTVIGGQSKTSADIPEQAIKLIKEFEGCELEAYDDGVGVWTIGYGATFYQDGSKVRQGDSINRVEAEELLKFHLKDFWEPLKETPGWAEMSNNKRSALLSFSFNTGWTCGSEGFNTLNNCIKESDWNNVPAAMNLYVNPGTSTEDGLRRRRKAEGTLWLA